MSGMFGLYHLDGRPVDPDVLHRMSERLAHRGPDDAGVWRDGPAGFGHRMLHTTPESLRERQPLVHQAAGLAITADARIDNRDELMAVLDLRRPHGEEPTDVALILAAYEKWGDSCPDRLIGDFAFAIWDGRDQSVFCARDPMGVKPFYYHWSDRLFVFGSEIKALLCLAEVPRRLNELQVAYYLESILDDREITFYEGIVRLPAAHSMRVRNQSARRPSRYWTPDTGRELPFATDVDYTEAFLSVFTEAVRCRLRSAFPVGSTVSGGLDSSSIACTARDILAHEGKPALHTFSAVFPGLPEPERRVADESRYIDAVVATGGFAPHWLEADTLSPFLELDRALWHMDEAPIAYNLYMHWALYDTAQQHGVRIFMDGIDGDTCVGHGKGYLTDLVRTGQWSTFESEIRALCTAVAEARFRPSSLVGQFVLPYMEELARAGQWRTWARTGREVSGRFGVSRSRLVLKHALRPMAPPAITRVWNRVRGNPPTRPLTDQQFAGRVQLTEQRNALEAGASASWVSDRNAHGRALMAHPFQYVMELADKAAAAFSVEPRYPFFDRRLMEFCVAMPGAQKLNGGWSRVILRRAMAGILPPEVQWRASKQDLSPNMRRGLRGTDRCVLEAALAQRPHPLEEYVDLGALRVISDRFLTGSHPRQQDNDGRSLYRATVLARWISGGDWESPGRPSSR